MDKVIRKVYENFYSARKQYRNVTMEYALVDDKILTIPHVKADRIEPGMHSNRNVYFRCPICNQGAFTVVHDKDTVVITDMCMNKEFAVILRNEEKGVVSSIW